MDDKALLEAIGQMMAQQKSELLQAVDAKLEQQKKDLRADIMHDVTVLMDAEFSAKFNLLAEGQDEILRRMPNEDDMDIIDGRLDTLEAIAKKHSREIAALKQAN